MTRTPDVLPGLYRHLTTLGRRQVAAEACGWERMSNAIGRVMKRA